MAKHLIKTQASERLQDIVTKNIRVRLALYDIKQSVFADALLQTQGGISAKLKRRSEWTLADIANAAAFFNEPVEALITPTALDAIEAQKNYQVGHNVPPDNNANHLAHNVQGDNSRRELAAPTGARYLRRPDDGNGLQGQAGPRAFMRVEDDFFGAKQVSGSAASRRRMLSAPCGTRTRKPMAMDFKSTASTNSAKGATVPC